MNSIRFSGGGSRRYNMFVIFYHLIFKNVFYNKTVHVFYLAFDLHIPNFVDSFLGVFKKKVENFFRKKNFHNALVFSTYQKAFMRRKIKIEFL